MPTPNLRDHKVSGQIGRQSYHVIKTFKKATFTVGKEIHIRWAAGSGVDGINGN